MSSKREEIMTALVDSLTGITGVSDSSVFRSRVSALTRQEFPAVLVEPVSETASRGATNHIDWSLTVSILVMVRAAIPDQAADLIITSVHSKIMSDLTLDGLVIELVPQSVDWQIEEADLDLGVARLSYLIRYQTSQNDITV